MTNVPNKCHHADAFVWVIRHSVIGTLIRHSNFVIRVSAVISGHWIMVDRRLKSINPTQRTMVDYRVELDVFNGPLDLLLYLIKRDELDIYDIPIARILESYMAYVAMLKQMHQEQGLDINVAGDFLVMAATLMEIKSAMLLPKPPPVAGQETSASADLIDPRFELVQQLLEYKRLKDSAAILQQRQRDVENRYPRVPAKLDGQSDEPPPVDLDEVQVWDLLSAFSRLMQEVGTRKPRYHEVTYDDTPIDLHAADIEDRLKRDGHLTLNQLIIGRKSRSEMIGVFLALLELIRQKKIVVRQDDALSDLEIDAAPTPTGIANIETASIEADAADDEVENSNE
jgi:segregation and condensation protein A